MGDLVDIVKFDWPAVSGGLQKSLYATDEPIPVGVSDLATLARSHLKGKVPTRLKWETLTPEEFERLIFALISVAPGYENPQWLTKTMLQIEAAISQCSEQQAIAWPARYAAG